MILTAVAVAVYLIILRNNVQLYLPGSSTQGGGITSLKHLRNNENGEWLILCGTKKGSLQILSLIEDPIHNCVGRCTEINVTDGKYPLFNMAVGEDDRAIFCGGSDRFVTILQLASDSQHHMRANGALLLFEAKQRLGPHTGWVQDVLLVSPNQLYSIGCNCIESWQKQSNQVWTQGKRLVIDSDIKLCTLSSDLLCLAYQNNSLFAGGVDGRIHVFEKRERSAIAAHTGRVNALITTTTAEGVDHVVSVSHDGWVSKWRLQQGTTDRMTLMRTKAFQTEERNTAVMSLQMHQDSDEEAFVVGTNQGTILLLSNSLALLGTVRLPQPALITAFLHIPHFKLVLVAHSLGLGAFQYDDEVQDEHNRL